MRIALHVTPQGTVHITYEPCGVTSLGLTISLYIHS